MHETDEHTCQPCLHNVTRIKHFNEHQTKNIEVLVGGCSSAPVPIAMNGVVCLSCFTGFGIFLGNCCRRRLTLPDFVQTAAYFLHPAFRNVKLPVWAVQALVLANHWQQERPWWPSISQNAWHELTFIDFVISTLPRTQRRFFIISLQRVALKGGFGGCVSPQMSKGGVFITFSSGKSGRLQPTAQQPGACGRSPLGR